MVFKNDTILHGVTERAESAGSPVLSLFLNVDQAVPRNHKRGYEVPLKNLLRSIEQTLSSKEDRDHFRTDADAIMGFFAEYKPQGKSIAVLCDTSEGLFWHRNLCVPATETARWSPRPYLRPLVEAHDEFERYGVILTDRAQARLFVVYLGEIEESIETLAQADVKRFAGPAKDQGWKQDILQRKADEHARNHLKKVADMMTRLATDRGFDRLILAGPPEAVSELQKRLPERMKQCVIGTASLPVSASANDVVRETARVAHEYEQRVEDSLVQRLLTASAKGHQAVLGPPATAEAASEGKILSLVYTNGCDMAGTECTACHAVFGETLPACPYCSRKTRHIDDLIERLVEITARIGGGVEQVRADMPHQLLAAAGSIGAFLRF